MRKFTQGREPYFALLGQLTGQIRRASDLLVQLFGNPAAAAEHATRIKEIEVECDRLSSTLIAQIDGVFIAPLDRADMHALATELDDIADVINDVADLTIICCFAEATPGAMRMARTLMDAAVELEHAVALLDTPKDARGHIERVKRLEEEGDRERREALKAVFNEERDATSMVKWLRVYDELETGIDRCKDAAKVIEGILVKGR